MCMRVATNRAGILLAIMRPGQLKTQKMSENGKIYTAGKSFTLPPAVTALTNSTIGMSIWSSIIGPM